MKIIKSIIIYVFVLQFSHAQISNEIKSRIDSQYGNVPTCKMFAAKLNFDYSSNEDKVAALYYWVTNNISFDEKCFFSDKKKYYYNFRYKTKEEKCAKIQKADNEIAEKTFAKRSGTSRGFALLFKKLCDNSGIECAVISGSTKTSFNSIGKKPGRGDHIWNAVKLRGEWQLVDVTFGAGVLNYDQECFIKGYNEVYYLTPPERFFLNHFPKDPEWLLINKSEEDFTQLPLFHPYYLKGELKVINPNAGIINPMENNQVNVSITAQDIDFNSDKILNFSYAYESERRLFMVVPQRSNGQLNFEIPFKVKRSDYLTIFCNEKALVTYKVDDN